MAPTVTAFRPTLIRQAASVSAHPLNLKETSATLHPPIPFVFEVLRPFWNEILTHVCEDSFVDYSALTGACLRTCDHLGMIT